MTDDQQKAIRMLLKLADVQGQDLTYFTNQVRPALTDSGMELADILFERMHQIFTGLACVALDAGASKEELVAELETAEQVLH